MNASVNTLCCSLIIIIILLFLYIVKWNFTPKWLSVSEAMSGCTFQWALVPTKWRNAIYVSASIQSEKGRPTCPNICVWSIDLKLQQNDKVYIRSVSLSLSLSPLSLIHTCIQSIHVYKIVSYNCWLLHGLIVQAYADCIEMVNITRFLFLYTLCI